MKIVTKAITGFCNVYKYSSDQFPMSQKTIGRQKDIIQLFEVGYPCIGKPTHVHKTHMPVSIVIRWSISLVFLLMLCKSTLFASSINSINNQYTFKYITIEEGLSHNFVKTIGKDALGYIWFGTSQGVNKYDGYSVSSYLNIEGDSTSLNANNVFSMFLDSKDRFWIGTNGGLCYYDYNKNNFIRQAFVVDNEILNSFIGSMCEDKNGMMWIGTGDGLFSMDVESLEIEYFPILDMEERGNLLINKLLLESDSILNIGTRENGFLRYNILNNTYKHYINVPSDETSISENGIESIYQDLEGSIWIGTANSGVNIFNRQTNSFTRILLDGNNERSKRVRSIIQDQQGGYWFGTKNGLYITNDISEQKFVLYAHETHIVSKLSNNSIFDIYIDNSGFMWLGTYAGGVNYTNLIRKGLCHFRHAADNSLFLNNKIVQCFTEDKKGNLWIGTEDGGLNVLNKKTGKLSFYTASDQEKSLSTNNVKCLAFDDNNGLWIGTYNGGLNYFDVDKNKFYHFKYQEENENSILSNHIYSLLYDSNKNIWVGTRNGLCMISGNNKKILRFTVNTDFDKFSKSKTNKNATVEAIFEDTDGNIFVAVASYGLFQFQKADSSLKRMDIQDYFHPLAIFQDSKNNLWMGTNAGLYLIEDFEKTVYTKFTIDNGLPSNYICGILEDNEQNLWISTTAGLVKFNHAVNNPDTTDFIVYDQSDGLQSKQFVKGAVLKTEDGRLFFGGINGFNTFYPDSLRNNEVIPPVYINEFFIFNKPVPVGGSDSPLQNVIEQTKEIVLNWQQSIFSFGFIAINYTHPEKNRYAYKMEGFDQEWHYTDANRRIATYTNLDAGKYIFRVKATNNDGIWNETGTSIKIIILPPWWRTWWFRTFVALSTLAILLSYYFHRINKLERQKKYLDSLVQQRTREVEEKNLELISQAEELLTISDNLKDANGMLEEKTEELQKLNTVKDKFFSIIAHDLRSPFTGFIGLTDILVDDVQSLTMAQIQHISHNMKNSASNILNLMEDLLQWASLQQGLISVNPESFQLHQAINKSVGLLVELARNKGIKLVSIVPSDLTVFTDGNMLQTIVRNLVSNALKFTSQHGQISVTAKNNLGKNIEISVKDTGIGMNSEMVNNLFRLDVKTSRIGTKGESGSGLGLMLCKEFIEILGGEIWVESEEGKGTTFYFSLPNLSSHK